MQNAAIDFQTDGHEQIPEAQATPKARLTCLLMEDDEFDQEVIRRIAGKSRHAIELETVASIREAREMVSNGRADIVLADYRMPDGDGIEFANELARLAADGAPSVIVVTGESSNAAMIRAIRAGVADFLPKEQLTPELFDAAIDNALRASRRGEAAPASAPEGVGSIQSELAEMRELLTLTTDLLRDRVVPALDGGAAVPGGSGPAAGFPKVIEERELGLVGRAVNFNGDPVDLAAIVERLSNKPGGPLAEGGIEVAVGTLPALYVNHVTMYQLIDSLMRNAVRYRAHDRALQIEFGSSIDANGNPIVWVQDNGRPLSARKEMADLAGQHPISVVGDLPEPHTWSLFGLCARLVVKSRGELKINETEDGRTAIVMRFPREMLVGPGLR